MKFIYISFASFYSTLCYTMLFCTVLIFCIVPYFISYFLFLLPTFFCFTIILFLDFKTSTQHNKKYFLIFRFHSFRYSLQNDEYTLQFLTSQILNRVRKKEKKLKFHLQSTISVDNILLWIFDWNYSSWLKKTYRFLRIWCYVRTCIKLFELCSLCCVWMRLVCSFS